ncbi:MAG: hypothetical protein JWL63_2213 [Rhodocyclales bacterium]|nr:hypothetical protein [Rhodocyclales bacterium]
MTMPLKPNSLIFDPWNGSGTTTQVANQLGHDAFGLDLNPAMVIVAKAGMLSPLEEPSLLAIAKLLAEQVGSVSVCATDNTVDPLLTWLTPLSVNYIRSIENAINHGFISNNRYIKLDTNEALDRVAPIAAFFYVALFGTVRRLLGQFIPTNPTWIKKPRDSANRKRPSGKAILDTFVLEVQRLIDKKIWHREKDPKNKNSIHLKIGNAENIPLKDETVDAIISSPPYCTRIDYAVATSIELAILRFDLHEFDTLRRNLTGTSTVERVTKKTDARWGKTCATFLDQLYHHPSYASKTYYFKNHLQYFESLAHSIHEIRRTLKPKGHCVLVIQDSHYKEIHNDVPNIAIEMAAFSGLKLVRRENFSAARSMVGINGRAQKYLRHRDTVESVLCFQPS